LKPREARGGRDEALPPRPPAIHESRRRDQIRLRANPPPAGRRGLDLNVFEDLRSLRLADPRLAAAVNESPHLSGPIARSFAASVGRAAEVCFAGLRTRRRLAAAKRVVQSNRPAAWGRPFAGAASASLGQALRVAFSAA
jgi:hypothetical protein